MFISKVLKKTRNIFGIKKNRFLPFYFFFTFSILILVLTGAFIYKSTSEISKNNNKIAHITLLYQDFEELRLNLRSHVIIHKDYLLTENHTYLDSFNKKKHEIPVMLEKLRKQNYLPFISAEIYDSIEILIERHYHYLDSLSEIKKSGNEKQIDSLIDDESSLVFGKISATNQSIENKLEKSISEFRKNAVINAARSKLLIITFYLISIILLIITSFRLLQQIKRRISIEKKLREANNLKTRFFSIIAHDLRSPFSLLLNLSSLVKNAKEDNDHELLEKITTEVESVSNKTYNLLNNLLEWARSQSESMQFKPAEINIQEIIQDNLKLYSENIEKKELIINYNAEDIVVKADFNMISTIVRNLLGNAVKFSNKKGTIDIRASVNKSDFEFIIADNGPGLSKEEIELLFRIDIDTRKIGKSENKGSGLGLILCKEFVDKHKGKIRASQNPGGGCIFSITIPINQ